MHHAVECFEDLYSILSVGLEFSPLCRAEGALTFSAKEYHSVSQGCPRLSVCVSVCLSEIFPDRVWSVATC